MWKHLNHCVPRSKIFQLTPVGGCRYVDDRDSKQGDITSFQVVVRVKPNKTSKCAASCQVIIVQLGWTRGEVELGRIQHRGRRMTGRRAARRISAVLLYSAGGTTLWRFGLFSTAFHFSRITGFMEKANATCQPDQLKTMSGNQVDQEQLPVQQLYENHYLGLFF